ncbi:hypothetical protein AB0M28_38840 [Streptomyces sp. NPDC051940]|uniref:COG4315 family predicted lipoprotein n=1 Tax=Streptomyces sp. NPDC051940 TaxID=3155675 RepID=UPI003414363D
MRSIHRAATGAAVTLVFMAGGTATTSALTKPTEIDELTVIDTKYGKALADGDGNALYVFAKDKPNSSACTDEKCATAWPAALAEGDDDPDDKTDDELDRPPEVTADFGTIEAKQPGTSGKLQLTVDKQPLYFYDKDTHPRDVNGHGVATGGKDTTWYLVAPDGKRLPLPDTSGGGY